MGACARPRSLGRGRITSNLEYSFCPAARAPTCCLGYPGAPEKSARFPSPFWGESPPVLFQLRVCLGQLAAGRYHLAPGFPSSGYLILLSTL